jgi:hypothetical protein
LKFISKSLKIKRPDLRSKGLFLVRWRTDRAMKERESQKIKLALNCSGQMKYNAQHLFNKKQQLSAFIHCTSVQWDL